MRFPICGKENLMSNLIPGNQKHLTQEDRVFIETSLDKNMPFSQIAKYLCKDPSTISKEVKKHRLFKAHNDFTSPNQCIHRGTCGLRNVCSRAVSCNKYCRTCNACNKRCRRFEKESCKTILRAPYVCNGCPKKVQCRQERYLYKAVSANRHYRTILSESRAGINISEQDMQWLDALVTPLILQGQTPYMILQAHPEINCSAKTLYNYIESGALSVKNLDLPRKVKYKLRKPHPSQIQDSGIFQSRTYKDFTSFLTQHPDTNIVEMDTVVGCEGSRKVFLTLYFRCCKMMLLYLIPDKTTDSVKKVFDALENKLGTLLFYQLFEVILTDRGREFSKPDELETGQDGILRTSIYYCDPMASGQKGALEKNHEYIRYVLPKGSSFDKLTQWDAYKLASHINSTARASLNGLHPLKLAQMLLGPEALHAFRIHEIDADDIILTPELLKSNLHFVLADRKPTQLPITVSQTGGI